MNVVIKYDVQNYEISVYFSFVVYYFNIILVIINHIYVYDIKMTELVIIIIFNFFYYKNNVKMEGQTDIPIYSAWKLLLTF